MGDVAITYKVFLEDPGKAEDVLSRIKQAVNVKDAKIEDVGFGIKVLKLLVITPDKGGTEEIDKKIQSIDGISEIEVESVTLL